MVIGIGVYSFLNNSHGLFAKDEIRAGGYAATLRWSNGKEIRLNEAKTAIVIHADRLSYNDGTAVIPTEKNTPTANPDTLIAETPRGGTYQVVLPDGTRVWLNAASSLKFPESFTGLEKRKVEVTGEAYFEVAKDKSHPFIVETRRQELEVLGTHFNVNTYQDEPETKTTLLEGAVKVRALSPARAFAILKPGEQSMLKDGSIKVAEVNTEEMVAWKNGYFRFDKMELYTLMRQISRWYNIDVVYEGAISHDEFSGVITRTANLSEILRILEKGDVHFKVTNGPVRKIIITP